MIPEEIMNTVRCKLIGVTVLFVLMNVYAQDLPLEKIKLPAGFSITVYASGIPNARSMALGPEGTLIVGNRSEDKVWAVSDTDNDGRTDKVEVLVSGLTSPNGVAFNGDDLYIAERSRILKYVDIENSLNSPPDPEVIRDDFPTESHHGWKYIAFGPDGYLYVPVGAPCNVCLKDDNRYASITRMKPDGSDFSVYASGIRNTVGFDWHPETGELWFTDNGRDQMGDDMPDDELNHAPEAGVHFGFPFCHGGNIADPQFGEERSCDEFTPPVVKLGAHVAALGMKFYTGSMFPSEYHGRIFIAQHGSWNRSEKVGYRVVVVDPASGEQTVFAEGWLENENAWGRPVDVLVLPDGALLVSDDMAGAVYRIEYTPSTKVGSVYQDRLMSSDKSINFRTGASFNEESVNLLGQYIPFTRPTASSFQIDRVSGNGKLTVSNRTDK